MSQGIDSQSSGPVRQPYLTYMPARNRFLGFLNVYKFRLWIRIPPPNYHFRNHTCGTAYFFLSDPDQIQQFTLMYIRILS